MSAVDDNKIGRGRDIAHTHLPPATDMFSIAMAFGSRVVSFIAYSLHAGTIYKTDTVSNVHMT